MIDTDVRRTGPSPLVLEGFPLQSVCRILVQSIVAFAALLCVADCGFVPRAAAAELSTAQKQAVTKIADAVKAAATEYQAGNFEASGKSLSTAMDAIDAAMEGATPEFYDAFAPAIPRIVRAQAMLELEGVSLRPFTAPERPEKVVPAKPAPKPVPPKPKRNEKPLPDMTKPNMPAPANPLAAAIEPTSFTKSVAPVLVRHCGRCHVSGSRGNFNMANYALLMKGPRKAL